MLPPKPKGLINMNRIYELNHTLDELSYHHESVKILCLTTTALNKHLSVDVQWIDEHANTIMYDLRWSETSSTRIIISVSDIAHRLITLSIDACWRLYDCNRGRYSTTAVRGLRALEKFSSESLVTHDVYWNDLSTELYEPSLIEKYFRLKRFWASDITTLHKVMLLVSVLNDCYKLQHIASEYDTDGLDSCTRSLVSGDLASRLFDETGWRSFKELRALNLKDAIVRILWRAIDDNYSSSYTLIESDDIRADVCDTEEAARLYVIREVICLLWMMPLEIEREAETVAKYHL